MRPTSVILVALMAASGHARADEPADDRDRADALFLEGRRLMEAHEDGAACVKFAEAIKLDPDAVGTMLNLGLCNQYLKNLRAALHWFRLAQARARATKLPDYEAAATEHVTQLAALVPSITIAVTGAATSEVTITIDGDVIDPKDYVRVELDLGHHVLDARAAGDRPIHQELAVHGGPQTLTVAFVSDLPPIEDRPRERGSRLPIYLAAGGAVSLVAGGIVLAYAKHEYDLCVMGGAPRPTCANSTRDGLDGANHYHDLARYGATPLLGAGVILVGAATILYVRGRSSDRRDRTAWIPALGPDQVGLTAFGRF